MSLFNCKWLVCGKNVTTLLNCSVLPCIGTCLILQSLNGCSGMTIKKLHNACLNNKYLIGL